MLCYGLNNQEWYIFVCLFIVQLVSEKQQELNTAWKFANTILAEFEFRLFTHS